MNPRRHVRSAIAALAIVVVAAAIALAVGLGNGAPASAASVQADAWIKATALQVAAANSDAAPSSVTWVLTDTATVASLTGNTEVDKGVPTYMIMLQGTFTATAATVPYGSPEPSGKWIMVTVDPITHEVTSFTMGTGSPPDISAVGAMASVTL